MLNRRKTFWPVSTFRTLMLNTETKKAFQICVLDLNLAPQHFPIPQKKSKLLLPSKYEYILIKLPNDELCYNFGNILISIRIR
jgi:hypothetical protein